MTAALDLGSSEFRSLTRDGARLAARRVPAVYTLVDDTPTHRKALDQSGVAWSRAKGSLVVIGSAALDVAELFARPIIPVLLRGAIPESDPIGRQVAAWLIDVVLPETAPGATCWMTLPTAPTAAPSTDRTSKFLTQVVRLRGYQPAVEHAATALALAELSSHEFTGAALCVGAESIRFALTYQSQPVIEHRCGRGLREILDAFATKQQMIVWDAQGNSYLDRPGLRRWTERGELNFHDDLSDNGAWWRQSVGESLLAAWLSLRRKLEECQDSVLDQELPLVISGGVAGAPGLVDLALETLVASRIRLKIREARAAMFDPYSVARGLLIRGAVKGREESSSQPRAA